VSFHLLAAVPAAPLLLRDVSRGQPDHVADQVADLRRRVDRALDPLADVDSVMLLAAGDEALVHDANRATLASYGYPEVACELAHDEELLQAVSARGQIPRVRDDRLDGDLAVLATAVTDRAPHVCVLSVTVPGNAGRDALAATAAGVAGAAQASDRRVALVTAGDLAATLDTSSPGYLVDGAAEWDAAAVAAVRDRDLDGFAALGPGRARDVRARGWAPLLVLLGVLAQCDRRFDEVDYLVPRGVGQLVAR
jgi:hypothetical protein